MQVHLNFSISVFNPRLRESPITGDIEVKKLIDFSVSRKLSELPARRSSYTNDLVFLLTTDKVNHCANSG
jgi:hypothetical protein